MTATERAAILRGLYQAFGMFVVTFLTSWELSDDLKHAVIMAGIAACTVLGFRAGGEGLYDSLRDKGGHVQPSDVGQPNHAPRQAPAPQPVVYREGDMNAANWPNPR
jgi:hypothetical protein